MFMGSRFSFWLRHWAAGHQVTESPSLVVPLGKEWRIRGLSLIGLFEWQHWMCQDIAWNKGLALTPEPWNAMMGGNL